MQVVDVRIFQTPRWFQYCLAVVSVVIAALVRYALADSLGNNGHFVIFSFAIALTAFFGGLGPGIVATALSLVVAVVFFILPRSGRTGPEDLVMARLVSANAMVWVFVSIICDLLRRTALGHKRTLSERDEHRGRLQTIFESMADGFFAVDRQWNVTHCNAAFAEIAGLPVAETLGKSLWTVLEPYTEAIHAPFNLAKAGHSTVEVDFQSPDTKRWYHARIFPDQFGMSGYIHDATYRKQIEDYNIKLLADEKQARNEAEQANRLKDEFIATLSHELRTPLTAILGWTELLRLRANDDERTMEGLNAIERSTRLQTQLVEDLLDMSRISVGKVRLEFETLDLSEIVEESVSGFRIAAKSKGVLLEYRCESEAAVVRGDHSRLVQIFNNLISNAVKFTGSGGSVLVTLSTENGHAIVSVKDTGQGITEAFLPYLFDRFRQANSAITRTHGGLGLGLSISKHLVDMHGGTISATSEGPDSGSQFVVKLKLARQAPRAAEETGTVPIHTDASVRDLKILVVEDDLETRTLLETALSDAGARVRSADCADAGIETALAFGPHVIVSDIGMPEKDGYEFVSTLRAMKNDLALTPAVALSALAREEDRRRAFTAGFQSHLSKPVDISLLFSTIRELSGIQDPDLLE